MDRGWRLHISAMTPAASSRCWTTGSQSPASFVLPQQDCAGGDQVLSIVASLRLMLTRTLT